MEDQVPLSDKIEPYKSRHEIIISILKWFLPAAAIVAFFVGLGMAGFCILFCSPTPLETLLLKIGLLALLAAAIYIPLISTFRISKAQTSGRRIVEVIGLTILGYAMVLGLSIGWIFVSQPIDDRIIDFVETTTANIKEADRQKTIVAADAQNKITFSPGETHIAKIDDKYTALSLAGVASQLDSLSTLQSYENLILISKVNLNGEEIALPKADPYTNSGTGHVIGVDEPLRLSGNATQSLELEVILPTEEVKRLAPNGKYQFDVIIEIWGQSPNTWKTDTLWSQPVKFNIEKEEVYFHDQTHMFSAFLPLGTTVFSTTYIDNKFIPIENDSSIHYLIRSKSGAELKYYRGSEPIKIKDYITKSLWGKNVTETKSLTGADMNGTDLLFVLVTTNKTTRPYKQIIQGYNYEEQVLELTELSKPDEDLEKVLDKYISLIQRR